MEKQIITRIKNGKVQTFEKKMREVKYDDHLVIRISSETKKNLIKFAKENDYKSYSELLKEMIDDLLENNDYKETKEKENK